MEKNLQIGDLVVVEDIISFEPERKYYGIVIRTGDPYIGTLINFIKIPETSVTLWLPPIKANQAFTKKGKASKITFSSKGHYINKIDLETLPKEFQDHFIALQNLTNPEPVVREFVKKYLSL